MAIELVDPLDYLILGALPEEGTLVLGVYPDGAEAKNISRDALNNALSPNIVGRRLGVMHTDGLAVMKKAPKTATGFVWQRTKKGKKVYREWLATQKQPEEASGGDDQ